MLDIIDCVKIAIDNSGYKDKLGAGIVLTGGCAKLRNIDTLFRKHTGYEVRIAAPENAITPESRELVNSPVYSTAVGLLIRAIGITVSSDVKPGAGAQSPSIQPRAGQTPLTPKVPFSPKVKPEEPQLADLDDDDFKSPKGGKKGGFFKRMGDKIYDMFVEIDDEI